MQTHIQKWGNSLAVRIPVILSKQLHLNPGSLVDMEIEGRSLVIRAPHYTLDEMLNQITEDNLHMPLMDDPQMGNEEW